MSTANVTVNLSAKVRLPGWMLIVAERQRQIDDEGWTPEGDDLHDRGQLAQAGQCYALLASRQAKGEAYEPRGWPWATSWWKPSDDPIRNLVKAGALIVAEIDRLQRVTP